MPEKQKHKGRIRALHQTIKSRTGISSKAVKRSVIKIEKLEPEVKEAFKPSKPTRSVLNRLTVSDKEFILKNLSFERAIDYLRRLKRAKE